MNIKNNIPVLHRWGRREWENSFPHNAAVFAPKKHTIFTFFYHLYFSIHFKVSYEGRCNDPKVFNKEERITMISNKN
jgi:hypothetical protein